MVRALLQLQEELFSDTGLRRLEARCAVENRASWKVLEKAGFQREGRLRGYFVMHGRRVDNYLYAVLRHDRAGSPGRLGP
jgi:RimJ/RimL family protein N-acetyltransferase